MFDIRWLLRAKHLAARPPSWTKVKIVAAILVICLILFVVEKYIGWPEWLTVEPMRNRIVR